MVFFYILDRVDTRRSYYIDIILERGEYVMMMLDYNEEGSKTWEKVIT